MIYARALVNAQTYVFTSVRYVENVSVIAVSYEYTSKILGDDVSGYLLTYLTNMGPELNLGSIS